MITMHDFARLLIEGYESLNKEGDEPGDGPRRWVEQAGIDEESLFAFAGFAVEALLATAYEIGDVRGAMEGAMLSMFAMGWDCHAQYGSPSTVIERE